MTLISVKIESQLKEEVSMSIARNYMFRKLAVVTLTVLASIAIVNCAQATTINGNMTVDNAFYAYVSTNNAVLGTLVASGNSWPTTFSLSAALTPGVTNYLQIVAINYGGPGNSPFLTSLAKRASASVMIGPRFAYWRTNFAGDVRNGEF